MSLLKIAVLDMNNGHANEGMRCIIQLIRRVQGTNRQADLRQADLRQADLRQADLRQADLRAELAFDVFNVRTANELPGLEYDVYISSGGPGSPLASDDAWERPYFELIDQLFAWNQENEHKKFVFLICHSFQLVVRHLGLGVLSERKSTSFGIFPVHQTEEGESEPLFQRLPEPFYAVDSRNYQITEPDTERIDELGATVLCLEKIRPHVALDRAIMAMRFSPEIIGTQFHPEADNEGMLRYFLKEEKRNQIVQNFGQAKYDDMVAYLQDPDKIALTESVILPGFLRQAIAALAPNEQLIEQN